jgi:hypothetical protein
MAKVTIVIEDTPNDEIDLKVAFDPAVDLKDGQRPTGAQEMAAMVMGVIRSEYGSGD